MQDLSSKKFEEWEINHKNSFFVNKGYTQYIDANLDINNLPFSKIAVKNSDVQNISIKIDFNPILEAPVLKKTEIGKLSLNIEGTQYLSIKIFSDIEIKRKNIFEYISYILKNYTRFFCNSLE